MRQLENDLKKPVAQIINSLTKAIKASKSAELKTGLTIALEQMIGKLNALIERIDKQA